MFCCNLDQTRDVTLSHGKTWKRRWDSAWTWMNPDYNRSETGQLESVKVRLSDHSLLSSSVMTAQ